MSLEHEQAAENSKFLFKIILGVFFVTYFIWYLGGGPERWDKKFKNLKNERIIEQGIVKVKS